MLHEWSSRDGIIIAPPFVTLSILCSPPLAIYAHWSDLKPYISDLARELMLIFRIEYSKASLIEHTTHPSITHPSITLRDKTIYKFLYYMRRSLSLHAPEDALDLGEL